MKKTVLTFGLISGAIMAAMMFGTMAFIGKIGFDKGEIVGYTSMVLAFLLVFFGIRSYRENVGDGAITFGRALAVGILIMVISSVCYVVAWEIIYYNFAQDFMTRYADYMVQQAKSSGASPQALQDKLQQIQRMKELYQNPFFNAAITFLEPLPVGLIMTLISASILRKKSKSSPSPSNEQTNAAAA
jgi:Protein of unknown function (DUF4199)